MSTKKAEKIGTVGEATHVEQAANQQGSNKTSKKSAEFKPDPNLTDEENAQARIKAEQEDRPLTDMEVAERRAGKIARGEMDADADLPEDAKIMVKTENGAEVPAGLARRSADGTVIAV